MLAPSSLVDVPAAVSRILDVVEYILFRLSLFTCFVLAVYRIVEKEWRKKR